MPTVATIRYAEPGRTARRLRAVVSPRHLARLLAVMLGGGLLVAACGRDSGSTAPPTTGTISGKVTDAGSGAALAGANVSTQPATTAATTDAQGRYSISNVAPGAYTVAASKSGYLSASAGATLTAGQTSTANLALTKILTLAELAGTYREIEYKFTSQLDPSQQVDFVTDFGGEITLTIQAQGSFTYTYVFPGQEPQSFSGTLAMQGDTLYYEPGSPSEVASEFRLSHDTLYQHTFFPDYDFGGNTAPAILSEIGVRGGGGGTDVSGYWVGTIQSSQIPAPGTEIDFFLSQTGSSVSGGYSVPVSGAFGDLAGTISGNQISFSLTQNNAACPGSFSGTAAVNGNSMTFTFTGNDCLGTHTNGQGSATRQ